MQSPTPKPAPTSSSRRAALRSTSCARSPQPSIGRSSRTCPSTARRHSCRGRRSASSALRSRSTPPRRSSPQPSSAREIAELLDPGRNDPQRARPDPRVRRVQRARRPRRVAGGGGEGRPVNETVFTIESTPIVFGAGASTETGFHLRRLGVRRVMLVSDPHVHRPRDHGPCPCRDRRARHRRPRCSPGHGSSRARNRLSRRSPRPGTAPSTASSASAAGRRSTPPRSQRSSSTHGGELLDWVNRPIGEGKPVPGPTPACRRRADDRRHRERGHVGRDSRLPASRREDGDLAPLPATADGDRRPAADARAPCGGYRVERPGRRLPRRRVVHRATVRVAGAVEPRRAPALPGRESRRRHLEHEGAPVGRRVPAAGCRRRRRHSRHGAR